MKQNKPHIKELGCYKQVADVIGEVNAQKELWKVVHCDKVLEVQYAHGCYWEDNLLDCFSWGSSPQGNPFWDDIDEGRNPYE